MAAIDGSDSKREVVVGVAGAVRFPSTTTPYLGTGVAGPATAANCRTFGVRRVLIFGYTFDVAVAGRVLCVAGDGSTEIGGTAFTIPNASGQNVYTFPGGGIMWEPPHVDAIATGQGANFGISCAAGITASAIYSVV